MYFHIWDFDDGVHDNALGNVVVPMREVMEAGGLLEKGFPCGEKTGTLYLRIRYHEDTTHIDEAAQSTVDARLAADANMVIEKTAQSKLESVLKEQVDAENENAEIMVMFKKAQEAAMLSDKAWLQHRPACEELGLPRLVPADLVCGADDSLLVQSVVTEECAIASVGHESPIHTHKQHHRHGHRGSANE